jgi:hypothetical protein
MGEVVSVSDITQACDPSEIVTEAVTHFDNGDRETAWFLLATAAVTSLDWIREYELAGMHDPDRTSFKAAIYEIASAIRSRPLG